jgi:hypothetical protein
MRRDRTFVSNRDGRTPLYERAVAALRELLAVLKAAAVQTSALAGPKAMAKLTDLTPKKEANRL